MENINIDSQDISNLSDEDFTELLELVTFEKEVRE
jgi:hypothetical protein